MSYIFVFAVLVGLVVIITDTKHSMRSCLPSKALFLLLVRGRLCTSFTAKTFFGPNKKLSTLGAATSTTTASSRTIMSSGRKMNGNDSSGTGGTGDSVESTTTTIQFDPLLFGRFTISPSQIFYNSPSNLSAAIVNLRPIVPGHVLIIPKRVVPKVSELDTQEYIDLWESVRTVQNMLEKKYNAHGFNIAIQDGKAAGQSVPHVHVHVLPRIENDFEQNDDIYDELEDWAPTMELCEKKKDEKEKNGYSLEVPDDIDRKDRTMQNMEDEAMSYRMLLASD